MAKDKFLKPNVNIIDHDKADGLEYTHDKGEGYDFVDINEEKEEE